ncbi:unnamed protein product, partial [Discosporangium mesarthrocarpum]
YRVLLREGDVLYMPAYWHHEVRRSLPNSCTVSLVSVDP